MYSQDAVESEGSIWVLKPKDSEPSVISNQSLSHKAFCLKECETGYWMLPLFGTISKPSTESLGVESWIASLRESHANHILKPEEELVKKTIETFGLTCSGLLGKWNRQSSSWKTSQVSLLDLKHTDLQWSGNFKTWVISYSNELYLLEKSEHHTYEKESSSSASLLPTISASEEWIGSVKSSQRKPGSRHSVGLIHALTLSLPTPSASDAEGGATETATWKNGKMIRISDHTGLEYGAKLRDLAKTHKHMLSLPTPNASEYKGTPKNRFSGSQRSKRSKTSEALRNSSEDPTYLNPSFGEAMMGLPIGWTELKQSETLSFLKSHAKSHKKSKK